MFYLWVDQTMPLTAAMRAKLTELIADWGKDGERVKIARFSANVRGQYTELMFDEFADPPPTQEYLFHLRADDKHKLLACLEARAQNFTQSLREAVTKTLGMVNGTLPKSDLLYSLRDLANQMLAADAGYDQTVLLVSDGLENSEYASFYQRRTVIKPLDARKLIEEMNKQNLIPNWRGAKVYMYGLGFVPNEKIYARPKLLQPLKEFWQLYFAIGKAQLVEVGTPELLVSSVR